jgi:hypothetical protein
MSAVTVHATAEQLARWRQVARMDLDAFLARSADFYCTRLEVRREKAQRLKAEGWI